MEVAWSLAVAKERIMFEVLFSVRISKMLGLTSKSNSHP